MNLSALKKIIPFFLINLIIGCGGGQSVESQSDSGNATSVADQPVETIASKLHLLNDEIVNKKLTFSVGSNPVIDRQIEEITGEKELSDSANLKIQTTLLKRDSVKKSLERTERYIRINGVQLSPKASKLDLRDYGLVSAVRDQGAAGACWAFGAMSAYESGYELMNKTEINASEQHVINCSNAGTAREGGLAFQVFMWMVLKNKNVDDERALPYIGRDSNCESGVAKTNYFAIDWELVDSLKNPASIPSVKRIKEAMCKHGVISASVYVSDLFQAYTNGVFNENETGYGTNHAISLIGWDDSKNAWILKNSWGNKWGISCDKPGESGYMWISYYSNNVGRRAAWVKAKATVPGR